MLKVDCPHCRSADHTRVIWSTRNLATIVSNTVLYALQGILVLAIGLCWFSDGWSLRRKCLKCGERFTGPQRERPDFDECPQCGYNLTGNISGRCSECGWKLPRRYRIHCRKIDDRSLK